MKIKNLKNRIDSTKKSTSANQNGDILKNQVVIMESLVYVIERLDSTKVDYTRKRK